MSLTRALSGGKPPSDLADWLEEITADAIAKDRTNIIAFPCKQGVPMTHRQTETEVSLADIVLQNIRDREAQAVAQQLPQLPQPVEPKESGDDDDAATAPAA
jgi:hypothetical protein